MAMRKAVECEMGQKAGRETSELAPMNSSWIAADGLFLPLGERFGVTLLSCCYYCTDAICTKGSLWGQNAEKVQIGSSLLYFCEKSRKIYTKPAVLRNESFGKYMKTARTFYHPRMISIGTSSCRLA